MPAATRNSAVALSAQHRASLIVDDTCRRGRFRQSHSAGILHHDATSNCHNSSNPTCHVVGSVRIVEDISEYRPTHSINTTERFLRRSCFTHLLMRW